MITILMSKPEEKKKVIALRRQGRSIKEIAHEVGVSRSSVSTWVQEIHLSKEQRARLNQNMIDGGHKGRLRGAEWNRQQRNDRLALYEKDATNTLKRLSSQDLFFLGLGLYWGEGFKARGGSAGFSNSDSRVIALMIAWLDECIHISPDRLVVQVFINDIHRDRVKKIQKYWEQTTGLSKSQFRRIILLPKAKKFYENKNSYYGVCAIRILKGTEVKDRINALLQRSFDVHEQYRQAGVVKRL